VAYCTFSQVKAIVDTDISDADITEMIEETDAYMDLRLDTASLGATVNRLISRTWTAYRCMLKDPNALGLGEYSENRAKTLEQLKKELDGYIMAASGGISFKYGYADLRWPIV
jgi:hypothetical protein